MNEGWVELVQKVIPVSLGGIGTWLAVRTFYEKKHQEMLDRYASGEKKAYAAQRDFEHLSRNQDQMKEALKLLDEELRESREDVKELKGMLFAMFGRSGETFSGIFAHREKKE